MNSSSQLKLFMSNVLKELPKLPADASFSFLLSHENEIQELHEEKKGAFCPNCSCPWSVGCKRMRLLPPPRKNLAIKSMKRREEIKRISRKEKTLLSLAESKQNALVIKCGVCAHEMINKFDLPKKVLSEKLLKQEDKDVEVVIKSKKKKKKRQKEQNAGLFLPNVQIEKSKTNVDAKGKDKKKKKANAGLCTPTDVPSIESKYENKAKVKYNLPNKSEKVDDKPKASVNVSASKDETSSKSFSRINKNKGKVKSLLKLNNCNMFKPAKLQKNKTSIANMQKAIKIQNMTFINEMKAKKTSLNLDSFLGSLI